MAGDTQPSRRQYPLSRSPEEARRLIAQNQLFGPLTHKLFVDAGINRGMRVLDVGSGAGDVALLAVELVGPTGRVTGVEIDEASVQLAASRAGSAGHRNVHFIHGDAATADLDEQFDAIVGRFVLMHLPEPVAILRRLVGHLRAGGVAAFQEPELARSWLSYPRSPALEQVREIRERAFHTGTTAEPHMALKLFGVLSAAGLPAPKGWMESLLGGGVDWPGYDYLAETMRSLLPSYRRAGVAGVEDLEIDSLAERLRDEIGRTGGTLVLQPVVSAWSVKP
jgi:SAM-dependent methyltransferase